MDEIDYHKYLTLSICFLIPDIPFTLIVPDRIDQLTFEGNEPRAREFLFDHVIPGALIEMKDRNMYSNMNQHLVGVNLTCVNMLMGYMLSYMMSQETKYAARYNVSDTLTMIFIEGNLTENRAANSNKFNKRNIQENNR